MDASEIAKFRRLLADRLAKLEQRVDTIETALDSTPAADSEERATEREDDEVMEHLGEFSAGEIEHIRAALQRIENGIFGECVDCGDDISIARLEAVPHAIRCSDCATRAE